MAAATTTSSLGRRTKIIWFWQSNLNPFNDKEQKEWKRYSDFENDFIEEAFQRKEKVVQLNEYVINFNYNLQFKKDDKSKQRPIKREESNSNDLVRQERFSYPERAVKSFSTSTRSPFCDEWTQISGSVRDDLSSVINHAAQGIIKEGELLNEGFDAQVMANRLRKCTSYQEVAECAARLYSAESFLYKVLNAAMRNNDRSKLETLGPFCWLLNWHVVQRDWEIDQIVYRGASLTQEMIEEYRQCTGDRITWTAFSSSSKNRHLAEQFGNTLFIINFPENYLFKKDISSISNYPDEQEVLIKAGHSFIIDNVEFDSNTGKHLIYLSGIAV
ncbi:unnamed protein product [Adineta steineri]|uniref:NAD(P)(+)--arginine ADP-ribosyltransferase n=1 Tax=Adineta steineri TaxID=433720 RepID=A0A819K7D2_9BILA|nr:unnamed protein product [Adineta steineri]CAF1525062.1 unnamed protein product [Adineta steineri]CAF3941057.1 unnamed protein product [Adineta steineri]CAF4119351.1 unnamed protein product [Adineta steineri]